MEVTKGKEFYNNDNPKEDAVHDEPVRKLLKLDNDNNDDDEGIVLSFNSAYTNPEAEESLTSKWNTADKAVRKDEKTAADVYSDPFKICVLPEFLADRDRNCNALANEITHKVDWARKQMDLYEFYHSKDLSTMTNSNLLSGFLKMLRKEVRPWLEKITNLKLDYVSASCSMYTCGDFLLVHDDLIKDRQVAFVYYLSPWPNAEKWTPEMGGCLEIFGSDENCFPQFPTRYQISPKNNQFVFFKVGCRSFHQVGEVTTYDYPRLTINGWFHGATNDDKISDSSRTFTQPAFNPPMPIADNQQENLELYLNKVYLDKQTRQSIQKRIEDNSEISLYEFLKRDVFEQVLSQLEADTSLTWHRKGPANAQNYEELNQNSTSGAIKKLLNIFQSEEMFSLLRDYTDLDLSGTSAKSPSCSIELQKWTHGNYTVLGDGAVCEENTLDLILYFNATEGAGIITYLSPELGGGENGGPYDDEDESVLLTVTPVDNALNIVYRSDGTMKFTKYVSRNTPMEKGPVYILSCSYKE